MDFKRRANLEPCYLLFLSILWRWQARRVPRRRSTTSKNWWNGLSLVLNSVYVWCQQFWTIFFDFSGVKAEFILDYWSNSDDFWDSLQSSRSSQSSESISIWSPQNLHDRPDHPDRTQLYPRDRGRLSRPGRLRSSSVSIWFFRSSER